MEDEDEEFRDEFKQVINNNGGAVNDIDYLVFPPASSFSMTHIPKDRTSAEKENRWRIRIYMPSWNNNGLLLRTLQANQKTTTHQWSIDLL